MITRTRLAFRASRVRLAKLKRRTLMGRAGAVGWTYEPVGLSGGVGDDCVGVDHHGWRAAGRTCMAGAEVSVALGVLGLEAAPAPLGSFSVILI